MGRLEDELERERKEAARREKLQEPIDDETRMADIIRKISSVEHPIAKRIRECAAKFAEAHKALTDEEKT
jgi:hypothetical protein